MIRVRFAPSPTGFLHVGGARTALFNWLFARRNGGKYILRIEDTDLMRSTVESREGIISSLKWLGLDWDEGPDIGGPYGPYTQSQRRDIYKRYILILEKQGKAYKCFCTDAELKEQRQKQIEQKKPPRYSGKCRHLTKQELAHNSDAKIPFVYRLKVDEKDILVLDILKGDILFKAGYIYDFILLKSDGTPTYNFGVVIDDALMKINYIIRGDDHLSNTPRQILLYEALGFELPHFAHIPMIHGADNARLSKRHGATSLEFFRQKGYLPQSMINFLALLGWAPKDETEILDVAELLNRFRLKEVNKSAAIFDYKKLAWLNGIYIRNLPQISYISTITPFLASKYLSVPKEKLNDALGAVQDNLSVLSDVNERLSIFFDESFTVQEDAKDFIIAHKSDAEQIADEFYAISNNFRDENEYRSFVKCLSKKLKISGKSLFMPLRVMLTGKMHGPPLYTILKIIELTEAKKRIKSVLAGI